MLKNGAGTAMEGPGTAMEDDPPDPGGAVEHQCRGDPWANILIEDILDVKMELKLHLYSITSVTAVRC